MNKSLSIFARVGCLTTLCAGLAMFPGIVAAEDESSGSTSQSRYTVTQVRSAPDRSTPQGSERLVIRRGELRSKHQIDDPRYRRSDPTAPTDLLHRPYSLGYWSQPYSPVYIVGDSRDDAPVYPSSARYVIVERRPDLMSLAVELSHPGHVVVLDGFHDGWRASVDGRATETLRANAIFRAVAAPAGTHEIELLYRPTAVVAGLSISAVAWLACGLGLALARREKPRAA